MPSEIGAEWSLIVRGYVSSLLIAAAFLAFAGYAEAQQESPIAEIREGHWLEIRGKYLGEGRFEAARVDLIQKQRYEVLIGTISGMDDKGGFRLLDETTEIVEKTTFDDVDRDNLVGRRVKVEGYYQGGNRFSAREIAERGPGRERLVGRADRIRTKEDTLIVNVMNFSVSIPADLLFRHDEPLENYPVSDSRTQPVATTSRNEDDLFGEGIRVTESLLFAGLLEAKWTGENNFDLNDQRARNRQDTDTSARGRFIFRPSGSFIGVAEFRYQGKWRNDDRDGRFYVDDLRLGETFAYWINPLKWNVDIQLGRIDFDEQREWIYDQNLDGLRLFHFGRHVLTEFSVSTTISYGDIRDENAINTILYVSNGNDRKHLAAYVIHREFDLVLKEKQTHYGVRAFGKWWSNNRSWLEISRMNGEVGSVDTGGWGFDIGNTYEFDSGFNFTFSYAWGQGDDPNSTRDNNFRQTGLQDNNAKFAGVTSFRYYGELVDPELVNLHVMTAGVGFRFPARVSLDLVGHSYRQDKLSRRWINSEIRDRPNGIDKELGWELDFILGWRTSPSWDVEIVGAFFDPGAAFDDADSAFLGKFQFRYRF